MTRGCCCRTFVHYDGKQSLYACALAAWTRYRVVAPVEHVVGMLMVTGPTDAETAWAVLSKVSQDTNCRVRDLVTVIAADVAHGFGLPPRVLRTLRHWGPAEPGAALLGLYARVAAVLLAAITATGVWSSLRRMPPGTILEQLTDTAYGRTLLAKVLLVAVVAALALWARIRLHRAPASLTACAPARAEVVALGLVVVVSGLLTALPLPIHW